MPFPFTLPTTSSFSFSSSFTCESHPSLPLQASTFRGVVRNTLKKHKRLPPQEQAPHLASVILSLNNYLPYLLAVDGGLMSNNRAGRNIDVILKTSPNIEWRPILAHNAVPGREKARLKIQSLEFEICYALSTLACTNTLMSRSSLQPLYTSATSSPSAEQRTSAITAATKYLLAAGAIYEYLCSRSDHVSSAAPSIDISKSTFRAQAALTLAEATLLAVLKDDPYPAAVAQDRNRNDKDWMIKAPEIPKVRAHLFARLCLAASEHAANALSLLNSAPSTSQMKIDADLLRYVEDLRKTARAKACRFFGIDAELGGQTGTGIAWIGAGMYELGLSMDEGKKGFSFGKLKKGWEEKREDRKVEKGSAWGADAGKFEEARVLEVLHKKWSKENDTINTQIVPPIGPLIATMPTGREMYNLKPFEPPVLDSSLLQAMRAPPDRSDVYGEEGSSDDGKDEQAPAGAFPGTEGQYSGSGSYY